jgi:hypothetical protein
LSQLDFDQTKRLILQFVFQSLYINPCASQDNSCVCDFNKLHLIMMARANVR